MSLTTTRWLRLKNSLLGRPLATSEEHAQLLPRTLALPVFASDPLSSVAYATEESMLVLALAGAGAFRLLTPISLAVAALLAVVVISYRQTIRAYPDGGGAFIVASENLGIVPAAVAAASLLTDYVLTVSVSVAAGVAAITSAAPELLGWKVWLALLFVLLLTLANLRGVREASLVFATPTYLFVASVFVMIILGLVECADGVCPRAVSAGASLPAVVPSLTLFLVLRAFASGATALTGVEAIANGVPAFREPKSHNAAATLGAMGIMAITMFLGISTLAHLFGVRISEGTIDTYGTVISQIGRAVFHGGAGFYLLQVVTAAILVLAANTAYQDFPRLSAILAMHRLAPRQLRNRGDRLVFSNGILVLAVLASLLLVVFGAEVSRLIQLYVVGVFTGFTLSQAGMVRHWLASREPGWRRSVIINAVGAATTGLVLVIVAVVKFSHGAWIVLLAIPILVTGMLAVRRHYLGVGVQLRQIPAGEVMHRANRVIVMVAHPDEATERALQYADAIPAEEVSLVHAVTRDSEDLVAFWDRLYPDRPLTLVERNGERVVTRLVSYVRAERDIHPGSRITVILAERLGRRSRFGVLAHRNALLIKARLLFEPDVVITDVTALRRPLRSGITPVPVTRVETVVLVSDLTRPIREALSYAEDLGAPIRVVHVEVDGAQRERLIGAWAEAGYPYDLEWVPSPYRDITGPLVRYVRDVRRAALPGTLINVVIPEFIVPGRIGQILHNQTGLAIKATLLSEVGVTVTSIPFHLEPPAPAASAEKK